MNTWYYKQGEQAVGPFTWEVLTKLKSAAVIEDSTPVKESDCGNWQSYMEAYNQKIATDAHSIPLLQSEMGRTSDKNPNAPHLGPLLNIGAGVGYLLLFLSVYFLICQLLGKPLLWETMPAYFICGIWSASIGIFLLIITLVPALIKQSRLQSSDKTSLELESSRQSDARGSLDQTAVDSNTPHLPR